MKKFYYLVLFSIIFVSCSTKNDCVTQDPIETFINLVKGRPTSIGNFSDDGRIFATYELDKSTILGNSNIGFDAMYKINPPRIGFYQFIDVTKDGGKYRTYRSETKKFTFTD